MNAIRWVDNVQKACRWLTKIVVQYVAGNLSESILRQAREQQDEEMEEEIGLDEQPTTSTSKKLERK